MLICNGATVRQADISATITKEKKTHKQFQLKIQAFVQKLSVAASRRTIRRYFFLKWGCTEEVPGKKAFICQHHKLAHLAPRRGSKLLQQSPLGMRPRLNFMVSPINTSYQQGLQGKVPHPESEAQRLHLSTQKLHSWDALGLYNTMMSKNTKPSPSEGYGGVVTAS